MTRAGSPPIDTLWYARCPVPTATSVAVGRGWLDEEFAPDGIRVISLRASTAPDLREDRVAALADQAGFLLRRGFIQRNVGVAEWIDPGPLALVRRAAS